MSDTPLLTTIGICTRAESDNPEIENRIIEWSNDMENINGVMTAYFDMTQDLQKILPEKQYLDGWESAYDNLKAKKESVAEKMLEMVDEMVRIQGVLSTYVPLFETKETQINAELSRLKGIADQYHTSANAYQAIADAHLAGGGSTGDTEYTDAIAARDHQLDDKATTEGYASTVKTNADNIFGASAGAPGEQTLRSTAAVNLELEDILDRIHEAIANSAYDVGTRGSTDKFWTGNYNTNHDAAGQPNNPAGLLEYFGVFKRMIKDKDITNKLDSISFSSGEFATISDKLVPLDLETKTASWKDSNGVTQTAYYPHLNSSPEPNNALLSAYYTGTVSNTKYFKHSNVQATSLDSISTQVATAETGVNTELTALKGLATSSQTSDWDTDLANLETERTRYSSWVYADAP